MTDLLISGDLIVAGARTFVGTPFHHGARLPGVGLDCIGVGFCAAQLAGIVLRDVKAYPLRPNGMLRALLDEQMVKVLDKRPGDILLMSFDGEPHHVAVYTGPTIIHAHVKARRCIEQEYTAWWVDKTKATYRFKELA